MPSSTALLNTIDEHFESLLESAIDQLDAKFNNGYALKNPQVLAATLQAKAVMYAAQVSSTSNK